MQKPRVKKRNWAFVLYPESAPADWRERLQLSGVMGAISPFHDRDVYDDGENKGLPKKPHYHVILVYGSPTTFNNVKAFTDSLNQPIPIPLEQVRGYYRYFTHKDNPDKFQYDESEIDTFNGFTISDFVEISKSEVLKMKYDLLLLIREKGYCEYEHFMKYVQDNMSMEYFDVASSNTVFFNTYLKSCRYGKGRKAKVTSDGRWVNDNVADQSQVKVDPDTGEVMEGNDNS